VVDELQAACNRGKSRISAFIKYNRQVEGWFKGELLKIAADLERRNLIESFHPDLALNPKKGKSNFDLAYQLPRGPRVWIELKHWYLGR